MALNQHNYGLIDTEEANRRRVVTHEYTDFLDDKDGTSKYAHKLEEMVKNQSKRLIINMNDIREKLVARFEGYAASKRLILAVWQLIDSKATL